MDDRPDAGVIDEVSESDLALAIDESFDDLPVITDDADDEQDSGGEPADEPTEESDDIELSDDEPEEGDDEQEPEPEPIKVTVDGQEFAIPADAPPVVKEIVDRVQALEADFRADYTRKTTQISERVASEAKQLRTQEDIQAFNQQLQGLQQLEVMYQQASVFATQDELIQLAQTDVAEYERRKGMNAAVQERQAQVRQHIQSVQQRLTYEQQQLQRQQDEQAQIYQAKELEVLKRDGITESSIESIFSEAAKHYGVDATHFHGKCDSVLVKAIADANKYRAALSRAKATKKPVAQVARQTTRKAIKPANQRARDAASGQFKANQSQDALSGVLLSQGWFD